MHIKTKSIIAVSLLLLAGAYFSLASAVDQIKTQEILIGSATASITSATSTGFSLYIGDNMSGLTDPVKSLYFIISGIYTGNGSLEAKISGDSATTKSFTLPNVGSTPTPFELIYKDPSNKINPQSAGIYSYALDLTPSGVTIYGLGMEMAESHRYKPPSCGTGYPAAGELTSAIFDTGSTGAAYNSILWKGTMPAGTKVRLQLATSNCSNGAINYPTCSSGLWNFVGVSSGTTCSSGDYYEPANDTSADIVCYSTHNNKRFFRYKVILCSNTSSSCTASGSNTPTVDDVAVSWSP